MTLYYTIFDFFSTLVFTGDTEDSGNIYNVFFRLGFLDNGGNDAFYMSFGDWLCHTATIISLVIIVVLCCLFVYKIIKLIGGLIR